MNLGDFFSEETKKQFAERNISLGKTLLIEVPHFNLPYKKYWIIVATNEKYVAGVIINTEINTNIVWNDELKKLHLLIKQQEHSFLSYDSYIDCSALQKFPFEEICKAIIQNPKIVVGNVTDELLRSIHITITTAKTISAKDKKQFGFL